jgi:hypothetical protein
MIASLMLKWNVGALVRNDPKHSSERARGVAAMGYEGNR